MMHMPHRQQTLAFSAMALAALMLAACATNPVTKKSDFVLMSEKQELQLGQQAAAQIEKQLPLLEGSDPLTKYVDRVGQRVAHVSDRPELFYRFHIVDNDSINAFALPGGYIYIHRGLLTHLNSEAELAAVLGHEVGHVTARHAVKQYTKAQSYNIGMTIASIFLPMPAGTDQLTNLLATAVIAGYGREAELQADELSLKYIGRAGYDVHATIRILETLERLDAISKKEKQEAGEKIPEYHGAFASHPETKKRIIEAVNAAASMQAAGGETGHAAMLAALDGYPYGDSPKQGAVVGNRFLHPELGIQLAFPKRWQITNTPQALKARVRKKKIFFMLTTRELQKRQPASEILAGMFPKRRMGPVSTGKRNGFDYAHAVVNVSAPHVSQARVHITVLLNGPRAYVLSMWSQRPDFEANHAEFDRIAASFRHYDAARDGDIPRISLYKWKKGDNWQTLAARNHHILGPLTADKLAALNGMGLNQRPMPGAIIKTIR